MPESEGARERRLARARTYHANHKAELCRKQKEYHEAHKSELNEYLRQWQKQHADYQREYVSKNRERVNAWKRTWNRQKRIKEKQEVYAHYGNACYCCGEKRIAFLTLDHIDGKGSQHMRQIKNSHLVTWAKQNSFPSILRLACYNCNIGAFRNGGICPHQQEKEGG